MSLLAPAHVSTPDDVLTEHRAVRPVDPPRAHAAGPAGYRVLTIGGRLLVGYGVLTHELALTGAVARSLARFTGHGFDVRSVITEAATVSALTWTVQDIDLARFDSVVLILDQEAEPWDVVATAERVHRLVAQLRTRMTPEAGLTLVVPPSTMMPRSEDELESLATAVEQDASPGTRVVRLNDRPGVSGPADRYAAWGETIAATVADRLDEPVLWTDGMDDLDAPGRRASLRLLDALDAEWEAEFMRFVSFAETTYGARSASLSVLDGDRPRYFTRRGADAVTVAREKSICDLVLRRYGGVLVGDAQADDAFNRFPLVERGDVRFFVGYRMESPHGQPLGAMCVFDSEPRAALSQDIDLLRDYALAAERRIWKLSLER